MRRPSVPLILAACAALACATNPATGAKELILISESQEIAMGQGYDKDVLASVGLYGDTAMQRWIQQFGTRLAATSERPSLPWTFHVVDDPVVNAFAIPGGYIYVTRGILAHLNTEAELAGVVGHEIGHVTARHSVSQMSKQQLAQVGLAIGSIASPDFERYAGLASAGLGVLFLKFSRDAESQADHLGLRYMRRANYDPREMPHVFEMLTRVSQAQGGGRVPEWLATHPNPENRRGRIEQEIASGPQPTSDTLINRDVYLRRLDGLVFGNDPREGYFKGSLFLHPGLRFRLTFPDGWTTSNGKQSVVAVSPKQDAAVELALATEGTADAAARAFLTQRGFTGGYPARATVAGLPAVSAGFAAATENGTLRGSALFVEYGRAVFRLTGYSTDARWPAYQSIAERSLLSFERLTDPAVLAVEPQRVTIVRTDRRTTIADLARERPSPLTPAALALVNQVELDTPIEGGRLVKWVVGVGVPPP
ncbi:MAG TPA: M48 family metalloprotease [Gemmatimonadales bacterium]|nr:M48 family metalloprotease [Gemmatimonadales bacterium]